MRLYETYDTSTYLFSDLFWIHEPIVSVEHLDMPPMRWAFPEKRQREYMMVCRPLTNGELENSRVLHFHCFLLLAFPRLMNHAVTHIIQWFVKCPIHSTSQHHPSVRQGALDTYHSAAGDDQRCLMAYKSVMVLGS